jgi:hypothetical protein
MRREMMRRGWRWVEHMRRLEDFAVMPSCFDMLVVHTLVSQET